MSKKMTGFINYPSKSKINKVSGFTVFGTALLNLAAQMGWIDDATKDAFNQAMIALVPALIIVLRTWYTVEKM